ncbi:MAG: DUF1385 domain-containing protein [Nitrospirae bacterium]|nr:MAG: DUF1385 domain-containing protein [Nitrospirota bacterium]
MKRVVLFTSSLLLFIFNALKKENKGPVGGQAVIEGVMMRSRNRWSVAVRGTDREIHLKTEPLKRTFWFFRLPLIRGTVALIQSLVLGIKAIEFSAAWALEEEDEKIGSFGMLTTVVFSMVLGIAMFVFLPLYLTKLLEALFPLLSESSVFFNLTDGLFRVAIFLFYLFVVGLWSEMRRIFEYHGAEHKAIHAYERGDQLEPDLIIEKYSPAHPRCGTSFLLIVMIVSILIFSLIPNNWSVLFKFLSRIILIPVVAGVSYELLKLTAKYKRQPLVKAIAWPGLALQRLTTREPTVDQLEVAIIALKEAVSDGNV